MSSRSEKERAKAQQEKLQAILSSLLQDEDNKYCEDCDAKGPRWASWNLGVFLCIRCAGIHRNMGVHVSRVKSVNLDTWTPEQVAMMQEIGNSRARAVYEANVPDSFQRPQGNAGLEAFIRAKYEQKKYIAREWVPPKPSTLKLMVEDDKPEKKIARNRPSATNSAKSGAPSAQSSVPRASPAEARATAKPATAAATAGGGGDPRSGHIHSVQPQPQPQQPKAKSASDDLLGLEDVSQKNGDLLADIFGGSPATSAAQGGGAQHNFSTPEQNGTAEANLFNDGSNSVGQGQGQEEKKSTKDSIMALYGSAGGGQPQVFGVPGVDQVRGMMTSTGSEKPFVSSQVGSVPVTPSGVMSPSQWAKNPFLLPDASYGRPYNAGSNPCCVSSAGGMYVSQQQMFNGTGMNPMMQHQPGMMGMQPGMMGQPMQQGMLGIQQQPGAMFGQNQMTGAMMAGGQPGMVGMTGAQMFVPQQGVGQQMTPLQQQMAPMQQVTPMQQMTPMQQQMTAMQQQMQFQQMQQQMANMTMNGSQMGAMQQPQQTAVNGGPWGGAGVGQTLSSNLWQ